MKFTIVIPTYNEAENLENLVEVLLALPLNISLLIIDDNSPDGTADIADLLAKKHETKLNIIVRPQKAGIGSAYVLGFRKAIELGADVIIQMDADFSHDPSNLLKMKDDLQSCDVVSGSRYIPGGSLDRDWPMWRKSLSTFGNLYARTILQTPVFDLTTGFRMWKRNTLEQMPLERIRSNGYSFQVEMIYIAYLLGFKVKEHPIYFANRQKGKSKMDFKIQVEAALRIWEIRWRYRDLRKKN